MDIALGRVMGCRTILVGRSPTLADDEKTKPDATVSNVFEAAQLILEWENKDRLTGE